MDYEGKRVIGASRVARQKANRRAGASLPAAGRFLRQVGDCSRDSRQPFLLECFLLECLEAFV